jgi:hypothetical protein
MPSRWKSQRRRLLLDRINPQSTLFDPAGMARLLGGITEAKALRLAEKLHEFFVPTEEDPDRVVPNVPWIELTKTRPSIA